MGGVHLTLSFLEFEPVSLTAGSTTGKLRHNTRASANTKANASMCVCVFALPHYVCVYPRTPTAW